MSNYYTRKYLRKIRNEIPINTVISKLLDLEVRQRDPRLRFRCPLCNHFHTATNEQTNLARCFHCRKNFNPIDLVMEVKLCSFLDAVKQLSDFIQP